jgi:hypothetical protein
VHFDCTTDDTLSKGSISSPNMRSQGA